MMATCETSGCTARLSLAVCAPRTSDRRPPPDSGWAPPAPPPLLRGMRTPVTCGAPALPCSHTGRKRACCQAHPPVFTCAAIGLRVERRKTGDTAGELDRSCAAC